MDFGFALQPTGHETSNSNKTSFKIQILLKFSKELESKG